MCRSAAAGVQRPKGVILISYGDPYATAAELKAYLNITDSNDDTLIGQAVNTASREVERYCSRQFNTAGAATARVYEAASYWRVDVDDFSTTTGLAIKTDSSDDGTYEVTWSTTDYRLEPANGVVDGESGWPYNRIVARGSGARLFVGGAAAVEVTALWGWTAVPSAVKQATLIGAAEVFRLRDAPFGVAGFGDAGIIRIRENPKLAALLGPYRRNPVKVG